MHFILQAVRWIGLAVVLGTALIGSRAEAQQRVALVIGNGAYRNVPVLTNPPNDASEIGKTLKRLGFSVAQVKDGNYDDIRRALLTFGRKARTAEIAVVFYAGHGIEIGGENWLIPIDAELRNDIDVDHEAIGLKSILGTVESASKLGLVILDACRNNPFASKMKRSIRTRSVGRGLASIEPAANVLVAYAAKDGTTAADGDGRNSPFTTALLKYLETPGLEINFLFRNVRDDVFAGTKHEQLPFVYGSLSRERIYLKDALPAGPSSDEMAWLLLKDTSDPAALRRFLEQFPKSAMRQQAAARIAALKAEIASRPKPPVGPGPDEVTWAFVKDTKDQSALRRFIEQFPKSPMRSQAATRIAALAAEIAAQPKPTPMPAADEIAWGVLQETKDSGQLKLFINRFPASARRAEAEKRIAALESDAAAAAVAAAAAERARQNAPVKLDRREIARYLQFELKRVGCFSGTVDGEFGRATRDALKKFAKLASVEVNANDLSLDVVKAVRGIDQRVCPLNCRSGQRAVGEICVPIVCSSGQILKGETCVAAPKPKAPAKSRVSRSRSEERKQPAPAASGGGKCFSFNGRRFCE